MRLFALLTALSSLATAHAQTGGVAGSVVDDAGRPVVGASVALIGTPHGATADVDGRFTLSDVPAGPYTLVGTSVGYTERRVPVAVRAGATASVALVLSERVLDAGEAVVTSRETLTGRGVLDLPGSSYYLGPEALRRFGSTDVHRVLREVPGVQVQEEDGYGLRPNVGLRGSGSERSSKVTLMEDGVLMAPAPYAAPAAYYFPSVGRMDGVEVRTGASQIKYGPYTTGGAVNLLAAEVPSALVARGEASVGQDGRRTFQARAGHSAPSVPALGGLGAGFVLQAHVDGADGFKEIVGPGVPADRLGTGFDKADLFGRLRLTTAPGSGVYQALTFTAGYTDEGSDETYLGLTAADFASAPFTRYAGSQVDLMDAEHTALRARHVAAFSPRFDLTTTVYRNAFSRNWYKLDGVADGVADDADGADRVFGIGAVLDSPETYAAEMAVVRGGSGGRLVVKANNRDYYSRGVQSVAGLRLGAGPLGALVEAGLRVHADGVDRFQWADTYTMDAGVMDRVTEGTPGTDSNRLEDARATATFVQAELTWGRLALTPGVRYERVALRRRDFGRADPDRTGASLQEAENTVDAWIPGVGVVYRATGALSLFGGVHRGFAPPDAQPETRPEASVNAEAGLRYGLPALAVQAAGYVNDYSNLLGSDLAAAGGGGTGDQFNGGAARVRGAELSVTSDLAGAAGWGGWAVPLRVAYTLTDGRFGSSFQSGFEGWGTVEEGDELPYLPAHQVGASLGVERGPLAVTLGGAAVSATRDEPGQGPIGAADRVGAHLVLDASASWAVRPGVAVFGRALNLTDETYVAARRPAGLRPGLPRTLSFGVRAGL
jgi:Fe(3+) dicitrate transport protein